MRIGIDCRFFSSRFTGIGRYTHELVTHFIRLNEQLATPHELVLFFNDPEYGNFDPTRPHPKTSDYTTASSPGPSRSAPAPHTNLHQNSSSLPPSRPSPLIRKVLVNAPHYSISEQFIFLKKLNDAHLDLVHFPHFNIPVLYNRPYIVTIHDLTLSLFPGQKMTRWYHRVGYNLTIKNAIKKAQKIIAVSENTKKDLQKFLNVPGQKISVIYNGISPEFKPDKSIPGDSPSLPMKNLSPSSGESAKSVPGDNSHPLAGKSKPAKPVPGNGTGAKFSTIAPDFSSLSPTHPFFLYTGVWRSHKNLPRLIEAFKILKKMKMHQNFKQVPRKSSSSVSLKFAQSGHGPHHNAPPTPDFSPNLLNLRLLITGNPDPHYPEIKAAVKKFHLEKDVIFTGLVSEKELVKLYNGASIFVFPSLYEGFGLPPLEAMACGTPVAASNASSIPEICGRTNAIFFDPYNVNDMAAKIFALYENKPLQQKLIRNGLAHSQKFSWQKTAKETFEMLLDCLKNRD